MLARFPAPTAPAADATGSSRSPSSCAADSAHLWTAVTSPAKDASLPCRSITRAKIALVERVLSEDPATQAEPAAATPADAPAQITHMARHAITDGISAVYMLAGVVMLDRRRAGMAQAAKDDLRRRSAAPCQLAPVQLIRTDCKRLAA